MAPIYILNAKIRHVSSGTPGGRDDGFVTYEDRLLAVEGQDAVDKLLLMDHIEVHSIQRVSGLIDEATSPQDICIVRGRAKMKKQKAEQDREVADLERQQREIAAKLASKRK